MSIIRAPRPGSNFYMLDKAISEDKSLGWAARGLLIYLLGKPDHWCVSVQALVNDVAASCEASGRDRTYALIKQLIEAGYVVRQQRKGDAGKFSSYDYLVSEKPLTVSPLTDLPYTAQPLTVKPTLVSIEDKQVLNLVSTEKSIGASAPRDDAFELAWKAYPKREGANPKNKALSAWNARLKEGVTSEAMLDGVMRYEAFSKAKGSAGTSYVMQAVRFFGTERAFDNEWSVSSPTGKPSMHHSFDKIDYMAGVTGENEDGSFSF